MEQFLTPEEIAAKLKVHRETVYNWIRSGRLKAVRAGRQLRVAESELRRFLGTQEGPPGQPTA